jgi:hypothetical protein
MTQLFADTFDGTDGTLLTDYSTNWSKSSSALNGTAIVSGGRARHSSGGIASCYYRNDITPPSADYTVRGKFYFGAQSGTPSVGICGRMSSPSNSQNLYTARFLGGTGLVLLKAVAGTYTTLLTYPYTIVADTEVVVDLKMVGNQISVYLNDALVLGPVTDNSFTAAGSVGIRSINSTTQIQISEMSADDGVVSGGVINTYSLPAAQGSYTITGNAAGLRIARSIGAAAGNYSLTGNPARLAVARRLAAAPGAYSITGNAASLIKGTAPRALQAAGGSYIITGRPAALRAARRLGGASGSYVLTGFATGAPVSGAMPRYTDFALMGVSSAQGVADLGPARIWQTANLGPDRIQQTASLL